MSQTGSNGIAPKARLSTVDAVKGVAIILMVYGHTAQGAMHRQLWENRPALFRGLEFANAFIYSFHMPAFFFVTGLFLCGSLERRGRLNFVLEKCRTLLYPYILWGLLGFLIDPLTAGFRSMVRASGWQGHVYGILTGNTSWFLITLFFTQLLALLIVRFPYWIEMLLALACCILVPVSSVTIFYRPLQFLPFLVAGMWSSARRVQTLNRFPRWGAWISFGFLLIIQLMAIIEGGPVGRWTLAPLGLTGTAMLLFLCAGIRDTVGERILVWFGEASLGIFILAAFFQGAAREFVVRALQTTNPVLYIGIPTLCASVAPAVLWFSKERLHIEWLFRWPHRTEKLAPSAPEPLAR